MSRTLKKKKHWSSKVVECAVSWGNLGDFGTVVEILGGAEVGQFPYLGQMKLDVLVCHVGKLPYYGDVLLEVNGTPVSGLTNRDTLAVVRHFREPVRLKTVKPVLGSASVDASWLRYRIKLRSVLGTDVLLDVSIGEKR
uniref:PDZ domain-containing protein n=1 Tax=Knipowitschia caucasica TaxID=637954 RepID=A0AAV2M753_KNICA